MQTSMKIMQEWFEECAIKRCYWYRKYVMTVLIRTSGRKKKLSFTNGVLCFKMLIWMPAMFQNCCSYFQSPQNYAWCRVVSLESWQTISFRVKVYIKFCYGCEGIVACIQRTHTQSDKNNKHRYNVLILARNWFLWHQGSSLHNSDLRAWINIRNDQNGYYYIEYLGWSESTLYWTENHVRGSLW